jgi:hypothetical protein
MSPIVMDYFLFMLGVAGCIAYACRIDGLVYRKHQFRVILMNGALAVTCFGVTVRAWEGVGDLMEWAAIIGALSWIWVSYTTWKKAPPKYTEKLKHLTPAEQAKVVGRGRD